MDLNRISRSYDSHDYDETEPLNYSKYNFPKEKWEILPEWEIIVKTTTFVPVILFGVLGNIILLNIIIRNRALRTPPNLLIANMAAADTLTLLICPVMFMYHDFFQNYKLGAFGCKVEGFLEGAILITAVLNLSAVSYDRLTAIVLPLETRWTIKGAKIVMLLTWIGGFLLAAPLAFYRTYTERHWKDFLETYCSEDPKVLPIYWHVLIAALVWFPLTVMVICYSTIFHKLDRYEKKVLKREHPISVSYKTKVAKMLFIVVITFVILRVPFTALVFIRNQMLQQTYANQILGSFQILWYTSHYLIFLNAAVNPVIYGLTNDNFRRAYSQTPLCLGIFKTKTMKFVTKKKAKRNTCDSLQPRGPCGEDRFSGIRSLFYSRERQNVIASSKGTKSTKIITSKVNGNYSKTIPKHHLATSTECINSVGFM